MYPKYEVRCYTSHNDVGQILYTFNDKETALIRRDGLQEWEQIMARNSEKSWKDEYMLLLFSVPLVLSFIPGGKELVTDGFTALEDVPSWYIQIVLAGAAVSYGIRSLTNLPVRLPSFGKSNPLTSNGSGGSA